MINDINTDPHYGDFIFQNDLQIIHSDSLLKNIIIERVNTAYGDYRLAPDMGANVEGFIGMALTSKVIEDIELSIVNALSWDNFLLANTIEIISVPLIKNDLYIRIIVKSPYTGDEITINNTFNLEGVLV